MITLKPRHTICLITMSEEAAIGAKAITPSNTEELTALFVSGMTLDKDGNNVIQIKAYDSCGKEIQIWKSYVVNSD